ncbi:MAG TPA: beta-ketoacyl synthase N-terminal-like domain-containing protein [Roseimicrobium sp.]|nr:beta-ketoacyl synthase N-terminal-like domain-containing protein [Roseimicrobium sp.]
MKNAEPIAIVGLGGIFPNAADLNRYWEIIEQGTDTSSAVPVGRWALPSGDVVDSSGVHPDKVYTDRGCFIKDFTLNLDGLEISRDFVKGLDEVTHLLLHAGRQAWLDTQTHESINRQRTGVIIGNIALPTQGASALSEEIFGAEFEEQLSAGRLHRAKGNLEPLNRYVTGLPAGILARALGLGQGSYTLDAACASSLYAIKLAADELHSGRADVMLSGGLSRPDCLYTQMGFSQLHALSKSGRCTPFDEKADGLIVGEGSGIVVMKRLSDALRDGDRIYGTIKGIGLSNDIEGNILAPSSEGQLRAMRMAYENAGWNPNQVDLIECHATGTPIGDAVEFRSLKELWSNTEWNAGQCVLGAAKSNVGHLLTGAGAAGLIKTLLAMKHGVLPPVANFSKAGGKIDLQNSPFSILSRSREWKRRSGNVPRRAAVSAFGFGGINAHLLVEEWRKEKSAKSISRPVSTPAKPAVKVAIVAMDAAFGQWDNLTAFQERVFGRRKEKPAANPHWWNIQQSKWFKNSVAGDAPFAGYYLSELKVSIDQFRIPPKELEEMLPQQLLMLKVAGRALNNLQSERREPHRSGVFIGIGLDLGTTHFHFRWSLLEKARQWNRELDLNLGEEDLHAWVDQLRDAAGPALNANRTMGALGGIVASRIAREFHFGGPSHTVQSEETSGIRALEAGVRALQNRELDQVLVGAVDLSGEIRAVLGTHGSRPYSRSGNNVPFGQDADGALPGEGAVALVLKRLDDAIADGDRIYSVVEGIGSAIGGESESVYPREQTYLEALNRAYAEAGVDPAVVGYVEAHGSGNDQEDKVEARALNRFFNRDPLSRPLRVSSCMGYIGHTGAASGLAAIAKAALSLYQEVLPGIPGHDRSRSHLDATANLVSSPKSQYWLRNRSNERRLAGVSSFSVDGNCSHVVLQAYESQSGAKLQLEKARPLGSRSPALFVITGENAAKMMEQLGELVRLSDRFDSTEIEPLAREWHRSHNHSNHVGKQLCLVTQSVQQLASQAELCRAQVAGVFENPDSTAAVNELEQGGIFFNPHSMLPDYGIAFVYPGSGNHYPDMGRELALQFPGIIRRLDSENANLAGQMVPQSFWNEQSTKIINQDHHAMIYGQVALGALVTDIVSQSGIQPNGVIGYSLGESAGLFSTRAWKDRDEMFRRMKAGTLFSTDLAGPCKAARKVWGVPESEPVDWKLGVVVCSSEKVGELLSHYSKVYLLIVNTPEECVIGGDAKGVDEVVRRLKCPWFPIEGVTTVHCDVAKPVAKEYHDLHLFPTDPPAGVRYYSGAWGKSYDVSRETAAASILAQALEGVHYPKVINAAYEDGIRTFLEMGPGASCSRMISRILNDRPHLAISACYPCQSETTALMRFLAKLIGNQFSMNLDFLFVEETAGNRPVEGARNIPSVSVPLGGKAFKVSLPDTNEPDVALFDPESDHFMPEPEPEPQPVRRIQTSAVAETVPFLRLAPSYAPATVSVDSFVEQMERTAQARIQAHEQFLEFSRNLQGAMTLLVSEQMELLSQLPPGTEIPVLSELSFPSMSSEQLPTEAMPMEIADRPVAFDREMCFEIAIGKIGNVLGEEFAVVDTYPTRVRLPADPLMLVDRIVSITGEPGSMSHGSLVTEHDIFPGAWYLDCGRIPTCIAVEAGQADLFLSGYLGIDFQTKGLAVYRLLDAEITFHRSLPGPGSVINYDIHIDSFFRQGNTWLFRFGFDGTVDGEPLLTMRKGCAGFFTEQELAAGKGIVHTQLDLRPVPGKLPPDWRELVPLTKESISDDRLDALRRGDLAACFGDAFRGLNLKNPLTLPDDRMKLVDRVLSIEPKAGRFGLGVIRAEADIHPDDWFLTCHFVDDRVMPGTLMYECCLHTLRILLLRMGWVGEADNLVHGPVPGVTGKLKCRGQVIESTKKVVYEISIKELGYSPEPYAIADALMYADGRPIVEMQDMSIRFEGWTREGIEALWGSNSAAAVVPVMEIPSKKKPLFDNDRILAFAIGKPSEAFGAPYTIFDSGRKIARLPGPPYKFLDRIVEIDCEPWKMQSGGKIVAEYDVPPNEWYFAQNTQGDMPFAVLLEIALQPCGWLAGYIGSALTSETDLSFRNLGGKAEQLMPVYPDIGTLVIKVHITKASMSGGMIIQNFDYEVHSRLGLVYKGDTYFGFFSKQALAHQVGIREAKLYTPSAAELGRSKSFDYPQNGLFPGTQMRMIDRIETFIANGGPKGLGFIKGTKKVNPDEWFFKAHFFEDPVCPGSLGLESYLQLMKVVLAEKFGIANEGRMEAIAVGHPHEWVYRGQILPTDSLVTVEAVITEIDEVNHLIHADGYLSVDGRIIYGMKNFTAAWRTS